MRESIKGKVVVVKELFNKKSTHTHVAPVCNLVSLPEPKIPIFKNKFIFYRKTTSLVSF